MTEVKTIYVVMGIRVCNTANGVELQQGVAVPNGAQIGAQASAKSWVADSAELAIQMQEAAQKRFPNFNWHIKKCTIDMVMPIDLVDVKIPKDGVVH
jgi:hypothetical protein